MHILVVCTANIARSPLASAMLASSLERDDIEVVSAGTRARDGLPAAARSQQLAQVRDLDLGDHRSQVITEELVRDAGLVVTMTARQRDRCASLAAGAGAHVFTLRELVRLLGGIDTAAAPVDRLERLGWVVDRAHLARPSASPATAPEDVHDPIRDPAPAWVRMAATLDELCGAVVTTLGASPGWQPPTTPSAGFSGHEDRTAARRRRPRWATWTARQGKDSGMA
jgi:protein-tyrosine phosphatase